MDVHPQVREAFLSRGDSGTVHAAGYGKGDKTKYDTADDKRTDDFQKRKPSLMIFVFLSHKPNPCDVCC